MLNKMKKAVVILSLFSGLVFSNVHLAFANSASSEIVLGDKKEKKKKCCKKGEACKGAKKDCAHKKTEEDTEQ